MSNIIHHKLLSHSDSEEEEISMAYSIPGLSFPTIIATRTSNIQDEISPVLDNKTVPPKTITKTGPNALQWSWCGSLCILGCWFGACIVPLVNEELNSSYKLDVFCNKSKVHNT
jgi:hypothetical protein